MRSDGIGAVRSSLRKGKALTVHQIMAAGRHRGCTVERGIYKESLRVVFPDGVEVKYSTQSPSRWFWRRVRYRCMAEILREPVMEAHKHL